MLGVESEAHCWTEADQESVSQLVSLHSQSVHPVLLAGLSYVLATWMCPRQARRWPRVENVLLPPGNPLAHKQRKCIFVGRMQFVLNA